MSTRPDPLDIGVWDPDPEPPRAPTGLWVALVVVANALGWAVIGAMIMLAQAWLR